MYTKKCIVKCTFHYCNNLQT